MYENDDLVVLFAAGNDGESGYGSVGAPGVAKNVLSIGAADSDFSELTGMASFR